MDRDSYRNLVKLAVAFLLCIVLYVGSVGPAFRMWDRGIIDTDVLETTYSPLGGASINLVLQFARWLIGTYQCGSFPPDVYDVYPDFRSEDQASHYHLTSRRMND